MTIANITTIAMIGIVFSVMVLCSSESELSFFKFISAAMHAIMAVISSIIVFILYYYVLSG